MCERVLRDRSTLSDTMKFFIFKKVVTKPTSLVQNCLTTNTTVMVGYPNDKKTLLNLSRL